MDHIKSVIRRVINGVTSGMSPFMQRYPPGHYYSPVPNLSDALSRSEAVYSKRLDKNCPGVHLQEAKQLELLDRFISLNSKFNLPLLENANFRYYGKMVISH